jgi:hypothetical protein
LISLSGRAECSDAKRPATTDRHHVSVGVVRWAGAALDISQPRPQSRFIGEFIVTLHGETEIRVDVVEAYSPEEAARQVSIEREDAPGTVYTVQRGGRLDFPLSVTVGSS